MVPDEQTLDRIKASLEKLYPVFRDRLDWLFAPNPDLDNQTPMHLMTNDKAQVVIDLLEDRLLGHPG